MSTEPNWRLHALMHACAENIKYTPDNLANWYWVFGRERVRWYARACRVIDGMCNTGCRHCVRGYYHALATYALYLVFFWLTWLRSVNNNNSYMLYIYQQGNIQTAVLASSLLTTHLGFCECVYVSKVFWAIERIMWLSMVVVVNNYSYDHKYNCIIIIKSYHIS